ncbi:MAG: hypothetical protein NVV74_15755 [Magnetospirillum sp.]|nr:hypothetical protein [Magnetospirillum sp.]
MTGYVAAKARRYMGIGADRYRRADHFHMPPADLNATDLLTLTTGMGQLATDSGGSAVDPLIGLTVEQVRLLLDTLHFRIVSYRTVIGRYGCVDEYRAEHMVTGKPLTLFATAPSSISYSVGEVGAECSSP